MKQSLSATIADDLNQLWQMPKALFLVFPAVILIICWGLMINVSKSGSLQHEFLVILLFGFPHIIASYQTFLDKEYLIHYKKYLPLIFVLILTPIIAIKYELALPSTMYFWITIAMMHHLVSQQLGICLTLAKRGPNLSWFICKWSFIVGAGLMFHTFYYTDIYVFSHSFKNIVDEIPMINGLLLIISVITSVVFYLQISSSTARKFWALNCGVFLAALACAFVDKEYVTIGVVTMRVVHDLTSYIIYTKHDIARNQTQRKNVLYRLLPSVPVALLTPLLSITLTILLMYLFQTFHYGYWLMLGMSLAHYIFEGIVWRKGHMHRNNISFG